MNRIAIRAFFANQGIYGRGLTKEEARHVTDISRRIAALLLMGPALDSNYDAVKGGTYGWNARTPQA